MQARQEHLKSLQFSYNRCRNDETSTKIMEEGNTQSGYIVNIAREENEELVRIPPSISSKLKFHQVWSKCSMIIVIYFQQSYNNIINLFFVILIPLRFNKTSTYNFYSATIISKSSFSSQRLNLTWLRQLDLLQTDLCVPNRLGPNINNHDPPQIGSGFKIFNLVSVVCR